MLIIAKIKELKGIHNTMIVLMYYNDKVYAINIIKFI